MRQEVDDYEDWWAAKLIAAGYDSVYAPRVSTSSAATLDEGLVTAFRREMFQLFRSSQVDLNDVCANISDANLRARAQQDNTALLLCLQPWETSRLPSALCIVNTQLASGPTLEVVRVLQTEFLCRATAVFNADFHLPIVLAGSFNALPSSDVYHIIHTGRRRPVPHVPSPPERPVLSDAAPTSLTIEWTTPECLDPDAPVLEYKIGVKNCTSATMGFSHEVLVPAPANAFVLTMLSAGVTYQCRLAARNAHGWSHFSQPTAPLATAVSVKLAGAKAAAKRAASDDEDDGDDNSPKLFVVGDVPPQVKPYDVSFDSGRTPRFDSKALNLDVCPRRLERGDVSAADAKSYATLLPQADRDDALVHGEQMASAYAEAFEYISEPELTFASPAFQGTIDYIFYSAGQLAPFQVLALPTVDELLELGDDVRAPLLATDVEWTKHKPRDWHDTLVTPSDERRYMGEWVAPDLFNVVERPSSWLPNVVYPSDHLALACVFAMKSDDIAVSWN